ncbi:MAG TPA: hypothetical protein VMV47_04975 [Bacteroidales bacterium]|nr:hypothetical protein [Bacteroidales bacterium]
MKNYDDRLEKSLTAIFGTIGTVAVLINLFVKGVNTEHLLDALKDIAGLVVVIAVFLLASKVFKAMSYSDFKELFEKKLHEWVMQNRYLIDEVKTEAGLEGKKFYYMLTKEHHKNIVFQEQPANKFQEKGGASEYHKGVFLYTDTKDKEEIIIGINKSLFLGSEYQDNLKVVAEIFRERIIEFSTNFAFTKDSNKSKFAVEDIKITENSKRLVISIKDVEKSQENAKLLIDMLEYIKTMILALA